MCDELNKFYTFDDILLAEDELFYENKELIEKKDFKHPSNGLFKAFYKNGNICLEINFSNNKKNGAANRYDEDTQHVRWTNYYTDDKLDGVCKIFYSNGKIKKEETFIMGIKEGIERNYYESGNVEKEIMYKNNERHGFYREYYSNGQISLEEQYKNDKQIGTARRYYLTGELEGIRKEKADYEYYYYKTGELWAKVSLKNYKRHGKFEDYYKNGKLQRVGYYKNDKLDGKIIEYYKNGKIGEISELKNGKKHGKFQEFYKNGVLKSEFEFKNDLRHGYSISYDKNGQIISKALFNKGKIVNNLGEIGISDETKIEINKEKAPKTKKTKITQKKNNAYRIDFVNCSRNIEDLTEKIVNSKKLNFSICIHGEPGTGKSAYAVYLANRLGLKVIKKTAADILDQYVGISEQKIQEAFNEAQEKKAMLIIDEVDSFLRSRALADKSWEVTMVNQMLTSMEEFDYPFVCTTNYINAIDQASLRRFTFKFKFGFLKEEKIKEAFEYIFNQEPNSKILKMKGLTVSDFANVKKECDILEINNIDEIADMLDEILSLKDCDELKASVGF